MSRIVGVLQAYISYSGAWLRY